MSELFFFLQRFSFYNTYILALFFLKMVYSDISAHLLILIPTSRSDSIQESFLRIKTRSPL